MFGHINVANDDSSKAFKMLIWIASIKDDVFSENIPNDSRKVKEDMFWLCLGGSRNQPFSLLMDGPVTLIGYESVPRMNSPD